MISQHEQSLRRASKALPIRDQRGVQSCVAICLVDGLSLVGALPEDKRGSALFIHYHARAKLGQLNRNYGVPPDAAIDALMVHGVCPDDIFPDSLNTYRARPDGEIIRSAILPNCCFQTLKAQPEPLRAALSNGNPVMICLRLSTKIMRALTKGSIAETGRMPPPACETGHSNHAVLCVGYDAQTDSFLCRNSLGPNWGEHGHMHLPALWLSGDHSYGLRKVALCHTP